MGVQSVKICNTVNSKLGTYEGFSHLPVLLSVIIY